MLKQSLQWLQGVWLISSLTLTVCETDGNKVPASTLLTNTSPRAPTTPPGTNPSPTEGAQAGKATGKVVDSQGRPVAGA